MSVHFLCLMKFVLMIYKDLIQYNQIQKSMDFMKKRMFQMSTFKTQISTENNILKNLKHFENSKF